MNNYDKKYFNFYNYCEEDLLSQEYNYRLISEQTLLMLMSMFKYKNLPDTIDEAALSILLLTNGLGVGIIHDDKPYILYGSYGGELNYNYFPSQCIVANPYLKLRDSIYTIDEDCINIRCDKLSRGVMPIVTKWAKALAYNERTLQLKDVMSRTPFVITANSDTGKESANLFIKRLMEGDISIVHSEKILSIDDVQIFPSSDTGRSLSQAIEYHQYLKGCMAHDLGLNASYNLKREYVSEAETGLNDDMLRPLIDNMLETQQEDFKRFNEFAGTNIKVELNSSWEYNDREDKAILDKIENEDAEDVLQNDDKQEIDTD